MLWLGDRAPDSTIDFKFTTIDSTGLPTVLTGSPVLAIYDQNGTTEITAGITLTPDFDGRVGSNHVRIVGSTAGLLSGHDYQVVITAGTVGGVSQNGFCIANFSCHNVSYTRALQFGSVTGSSSTTGFADSALPSRPDNTWRYRIIVVDTGTYAGAVTDIKTYVDATKSFTFTALPGALTAGDKYRII
jgi:hypothetical protein